MLAAYPGGGEKHTTAFTAASSAMARGARTAIRTRFWLRGNSFPSFFLFSFRAPLDKDKGSLKGMSGKPRPTTHVRGKEGEGPAPLPDVPVCLPRAPATACHRLLAELLGCSGFWVRSGEIGKEMRSHVLDQQERATA